MYLFLRSACLIPNCGAIKSDLKEFKQKAIEKLITLAEEREHNEFLSQRQCTGQCDAISRIA